jgi:hypothetical protein
MRERKMTELKDLGAEESSGNKRGKKRKQGTVIALIVLALVIVCASIGLILTSQKSDHRASQSKKTTKTASEKTEKEETQTPAQPTSILTGLPVTEEQRNTRPVALMIENTKVTQPQYGTTKAAVIYEAPAEGGITRLMGVFEDYSGLERFGNVRSCRPYFVQMAAEYDAVYVHFGQSEQGQAELDKGYVDELNGLSGIGGTVFYRTQDRKAPHNAYTSTKGLLAGMQAKNFETTYKADEHTHFQFASADQPSVPAGDDCAAVQLYFYDNKPYFVYDAASGQYNRFEFGSPQIDAAANNAQLTATNIILQFTPSSYYDNEHYRMKIDLIGSGSGKFLTKGKIIDITWKKDSETGITHYYDGNGKEIVLNPGRTWISIVEQNAEAKNTYYKTIDEFNNR